MNKKTLILCTLTFAFYILHFAFGLSPNSPSSANDVTWQNGTCPVCLSKIKLAVVTACEKTSGIDRDLFIRAAGPQPEFYLVNTCPVCAFSGYLSDFDLVIPKDLRQKIKISLVPPHPINPKLSQREIDTLDKYELALQTFKLLGRTDEAYGWLCLRASWVARDLYCNLPKLPGLIKALFDAGNLVPLAKDTNPAERELDMAHKLEIQLVASPPPVKLRWAYNTVVAFLYRRHGQNTKAMQYIERVLDDKNTPATVRELLSKMKGSIDDERRWQTHAAEHFDRAFTLGTISPANKPIAKYLLAQFYVATGQKADAKRWLNEAILDPKLPPDLVKWAKEAQEQLK